MHAEVLSRVAKLICIIMPNCALLWSSVLVLNKVNHENLRVMLLKIAHINGTQSSMALFRMQESPKLPLQN